VYVAEIAKHKGPPVFTEQERYNIVRAIKWVDQVCSRWQVTVSVILKLSASVNVISSLLVIV